MFYGFWLNHLSPKVNCCTKKLDILPTFTKLDLAQIGEHQIGMDKVPSSIPTGANVLYWIYFYQHCQLFAFRKKTLFELRLVCPICELPLHSSGCLEYCFKP